MSHSPRIEEDYEAIEAAVLESPRGRWFLAEYLRRNQASETKAMLAAIRKLERAIRPPAPGNGEAGTAAAMTRAAEEIAALTGGQSPRALPDAVMDMAAEAAEIAARLEDLPEDTTALSAQAAILASRQHNLARRVEILASALAGIGSAGGQPQAAAEPELSEDNLGWFEAEEDLFDDEDGGMTRQEPPHATAPAVEDAAQDEAVMDEEAAEEDTSGRMSIIIKPRKEARNTPDAEPDGAKSARPRITITRKPSSTEVDIPRLEKDPETAA